MNQLLTELSVNGCNIDSALKICGGLESLYIKLLGKFISKNYIDMLLDAYKSHNVSELFYQSHTLKGVYLSLGFTRLYELNNPLLDALRGESPDVFEKYPIEKWVHLLVDEHMNIVQIINDLLILEKEG